MFADSLVLGSGLAVLTKSVGETIDGSTMSDGTQKSVWTRGYDAGYAQAQAEFVSLMEKATLVARPDEPNPNKGQAAPPGRLGQRGKNNGSIEREHRTRRG